ncbi:MAG: LLM class flavin-dependent oxidoreductase, partial [Promethearchaeota archaeon]
MKFGLYIRSGQTYAGMLELAQYADELGLFGVFLNDHVHGFANEGKEPYLEAWTAMTGIGVQTKRVRLGHIVLFNSLRNPAFLAKSIATLDQMSNGRYELLIGAGWNVPEYEGYDLMEKGRGMPSAKERVDRFKEALEILRGMLTNEEFSYNGKYWILKNAINIPQPVQKSMKISVGASKPRMIRISARYADGLNTGGDLQELKDKIK